MASVYQARSRSSSGKAIATVQSAALPALTGATYDIDGGEQILP